MNSNHNKKDLIGELKESLRLKNDIEKIEFERDKIQLDLMHLVSMIMTTQGWTKAELADKINTSKAYISQLFSCDKKLNLETLAKIKFVSNSRFRFVLDEKQSRLAEFDMVKKIIKEDFVDDTNNQIVDEAYLGLQKDKYKDATEKYKMVA